MSPLVADNGVAIKWFVVEPYSAEARRILDDYRVGVVSFLAPDLINAEFGNVVWKKHLFQGLAAADARQIIADFRKLAFRLTPSGDLLEEAVDLAMTHRRTVYDALYLALSLREGCPFVTADEKLFNALHTSFPSLIWLAHW